MPACVEALESCQHLSMEFSEEAYDDPLQEAPGAGVHFVEALASMLTHRASLAETPQQVSVFHSESVPPMSIHDYLMRIAKYFQCSNECFVLSLVYIDRIGKQSPEFAISEFSMHRLQLTSIIVALKFYDEGNYLNSYYANVGGITTHEVNGLEMEFLKLLGWKLHVMPEEYDECRKRVLQRMPGQPQPHCGYPAICMERRRKPRASRGSRRCRRESRQRISA